MEEKPSPPLEPSLLSDDEFARLLIKESKASAENDDKDAEQRIWRNIEKSLARRRHIPFIPWLAAAAAVLVVSIAWLRPVGESEMTPKQGIKESAAVLDLSLSQKNGDFSLDLRNRPPLPLAIALITPDFPLVISWIGLSSDWTKPLPLAASFHICLLVADTLQRLEEKIALINELKQFPEDLKCVKN